MSAQSAANDVTKEKLVADLKVVVADAEELLRATASQAGEKAAAARERIQASLATAKVKLTEAERALLEKSRLAAKATDEYVREMFRESEGRIRSMAMVHEQLYRSSSLASVDFGAYLERLAWDLYGAFNIYNAVELSVQTQPVVLEIKQAIPCGLLVNEMITNAFKHAFPHGRRGQVQVELEQQGEMIQIRIGDDGTGIPAEIDVEQAETMGLKLITLLARQVEGELSVEREKGTSFTLRFKGGE